MVVAMLVLVVPVGTVSDACDNDDEAAAAVGVAAVAVVVAAA